MNIPKHVRQEHAVLIQEMKSYAIDFHMAGKCECMKGITPITERNYLPCKHLNKAQYNRFKQRIDELGEVFDEIWMERLESARNQPYANGEKK